MSLLTPSAAKGQPFFEAASSLRQHDNASDNMAAGAYSHNPLEGSATEADEWTSIMLYLFQVAKAGGGAISVRNASGGALSGPIRVSGYDVANSAFLVSAADAAGNLPANALLLASVANNTNGVAYLGGLFTSSIDTSASAVGNPAYLAVGGGVTLTAPTGADQIQQVIGRVQTLANPGVIAGLVLPPLKIGTSWLQNSSVDLTSKVAGVLPIANGGTNSAVALSNNQLMSSQSGAVKELGAMTDGQLIVGKTSNAPQIVTPSGDWSITNAGTTVNAKINGNSFPSGAALGDTFYGSAANVISKLAGNTAAVRKFMRQTGTGSVSAAPAWDTLADGDLPATLTQLINFAGSGGNEKCLQLNGVTVFAGAVKPTANAGGDLWYETTSGHWWLWNATDSRWYSVQLYTNTLNQDGAGFNTAGATQHCLIDPWQADNHNILILDVFGSTFVSGTNTGSAFWTFQLNKLAAAGTATAITGAAFNTSTDTVSNWTRHKVRVTSANGFLDLTTDIKALRMDQTKTSTPGTLFGGWGYSYRLAHN